jgi:hypothetical protein
MTALERLLISVLAAVVLLAVGILGVRAYGAHRYDAGHAAGYAAAVAAGNAQRDRDAATARKTESDLRTQLAARDADAHRKEQKYASNLEAAQRRVRVGTDRLHCPAASPVQPAAAPADRPAAGGPAADGGGADLVPEAAADVLGDGATAAGLVRKYARLIQRFEACRAVNARQ